MNTSTEHDRRRPGNATRDHGYSMSGYFFDELKTYVGFDDETGELLRECVPYVEPHYGKVVESFYDALVTNPRTRNVFEGPEQIERLRKTLKAWLAEGLNGPWGDAYFERRMRTGTVHVEVGLLPHFLGGAINIIRRHLIRIVDEADELGTRHLEAVARLLDLDLTIMMQSYWDHMMKLKLEVPLALATGLAHEIRNPLNAIGLNLTLLERKVDDADAKEIVAVLRDELDRVSSLTTELMDFAKPIELRPSWTRADQLLAEFEAMHGATLAADGIEFTAVSEGDPFIWCDVDRLRQALANLVTNAAEAIRGEQATTNGDATIGQVWLEVVNHGRGTAIEVSDTGAGMDPKISYQIFDLFFTQKAAGTGLGLPIVKNIIDAHGGTIEVSSRPGEGTSVLIRLPRPARMEEE